LFFSEAISPDKNKHVINLYFLVIVKNDSEPMKIGDESNLSDLRYVSKEEIKDIKLYPNIKEQLLKILNNEQMSSYLGLLWDN
jgi:8-oxo-dGTP diphosphatase